MTRTRSCFTAFSRTFAVAPCDSLRSPRLVINGTDFGATSQGSGWDTQNTRVSAPDGVNRRDSADPALPEKNADGLVPTMSGDVIVKLATSNVDDRTLQQELGHKVGAIVADTLPLSHGERRSEIKRRVRVLLA